MNLFDKGSAKFLEELSRRMGGSKQIVLVLNKQKDVLDVVVQPNTKPFKGDQSHGKTEQVL